MVTGTPGPDSSIAAESRPCACWPIRAGVLLAVLFVVGWQAAPALGADRVYWSNGAGAAISFASLDATTAGDLATTGATTSFPAGVAVDFAAGRIYWANHNANKISFASLDGSGGGDLNTAGATVDHPFGVAVDPAAGRIYWANQISAGKISFANLDGSGGGDLNTTGATVSEPSGVAVDPGAGRIYWADLPANKISFANVDGSGGGDLATTGATVNGPAGVAVDPAAGRVYWANLFGNKISFANLSGSGGGDVSTLTATVNNPEGVAVDPAAGRIYWANASANNISFANLDGTGAGDLATLTATVNGPTFPVLLKRPSGTSVPTISGGTSAGSTLSCSRGSWASDLLPAFLYRAPQSIAYQWSLNGADIAGATASSYMASAPGSYACRVTAANLAGSSTQTSTTHTVLPPPTTAPAPTSSFPPKLSAVTQSRRTWRGGNKLAAIARKRKTPVGTTFSFTLNEQAQVSFAFSQRLAGRNVNDRCVAQTTKNRRRRPCNRTLIRARLTFSAHSGPNIVFFQGRISSAKKLKPGRYTLIIVAVNPAGQRSKSVALSFTIVT